MTHNKKALLCIVTASILFLTALSGGFALELKEGRMKIVLHENMGKFSAYYLHDLSANKYTPLFLDQDPRTSSLSIIEDNKVYRMGESSGFRQIIESTSAGAKFIWQSSSLEVTEELSFINSSASPVADGILVAITVTNIAETRKTTGIRYIFDTYLGEDNGTHFTTATVNKISGETSYFKYNLPEYINSPGEEGPFGGFQIMLEGRGITNPDKVVLANWKRLNDATWDYDVKSSRNFNQLPYSINDSGAALYYNQQDLTPGASRTVTLAMGAYNADGFSADASSTKSEIANVFNQTMNTNPSTGGDTGLSVQTDLLTVNELLKKINKRIDAGEMPTDAELELMDQVITELTKRKQKYSAD